MKNCMSGGKHMGAHLRKTSKQPSRKRISKLMKKKWEKKNHGILDRRSSEGIQETS